MKSWLDQLSSTISKKEKFLAYRKLKTLRTKAIAPRPSSFGISFNSSRKRDFFCSRLLERCQISLFQTACRLLTPCRHPSRIVIGRLSGQLAAFLTHVGIRIFLSPAVQNKVRIFTQYDFHAKYSQRFPPFRVFVSIPQNGQNLLLASQNFR